VVPYNGTALVDKFNVECTTPFEDEHKPYSYEVTVAGSSCCQDQPENIPKWTFFHKGDVRNSSTFLVYQLFCQIIFVTIIMVKVER